MKSTLHKRLLATAGAVAFAASAFSPAQAAEDSKVMTEFSLYTGATVLVTDEQEDSVEWVGGAKAKLGFNVTDMVGVQIDLLGEATSAFTDSSFDDEGRQNINGAVHVFYRDSDFAAGAFGSLDYFGVVDEKKHLRSQAGIEGQIYLENTTLYGQVGANIMLESKGDDHAEPVTGYFLRGVVRQFLTPRDKIEAEFAFFRADDVNTGNQGPVNSFDWGISYEHQFADMPLSAFVNYIGFVYNDKSHSDSPYQEHIGLIGVTWRFNQTDLRTADRRGTSFDTHTWRGINWLAEAH